MELMMEEPKPPSDLPPEPALEPEPLIPPVEPLPPSSDLSSDFTPETQIETLPVIPPIPPSGAPPEMTPGLEPMSSSSERTWAMISHLSILLNLFTGFLGPIVALIIYLVFKERSRYVAYQAMQSFVFQLVFFMGAGLLAAIVWVISLSLAIFLVGCCLIPFAFVLSLVPFLALVYGVVGAVQTSSGDDFRYWLVGDWVLPKGGSPGPVY
jgi:uncharacterized Tic20 family protein